MRKAEKQYRLNGKLPVRHTRAPVASATNRAGERRKNRHVPSVPTYERNGSEKAHTQER